MLMAKRRDPHNPFEDFDEGEFQPPAGGTPAEAPATQTEAELVSGEAIVEAISVDQAYPDLYQTRHPVLPPEVRERFWDGEIDCFQAAREWLAYAEQDPVHQERVQELLHMGGTFQTEGQVNPITGRWAMVGDNEFVFLIETGERRYWAAILQAVLSDAAELPTINVVGYERTSRRRQFLENIHQANPSAVSQARGIAALLLDLRGVTPPVERPDDLYTYFRQALDFEVSAEEWEQLSDITGLSDRRMRQVLSVLQLPTPLLDVADLYELASRQLLEIVRRPAFRWKELVRQAVIEKSDQEAEIPDWLFQDQARPTQKAKSDRRRDPATVALGGVRRFRNALRSVEGNEQDAVIGRLATDIAVEEDAGETLDYLKRLALEVEVRLQDEGA
jgi:hypothetical protein